MGPVFCTSLHFYTNSSIQSVDFMHSMSNRLYYLQQHGLLLGEMLELLKWLQEQSGLGEDHQAFLCSHREMKFSFVSLHVLQRASHGLHVSKDHLQVEADNYPVQFVNNEKFTFRLNRYICWLSF